MLIILCFFIGFQISSHEDEKHLEDQQQILSVRKQMVSVDGMNEVDLLENNAPVLTSRSILARHLKVTRQRGNKKEQPGFFNS